MTDLTKLSEKAAKRLGLSGEEDCFFIPKDGGGYQPFSYALFESEGYAPILAHLALEKIEKEYEHQGGWYGGVYWYRIWPTGTEEFDTEAYAENDKRYIALWLAIEKTGVLDG